MADCLRLQSHLPDGPAKRRREFVSKPAHLASLGQSAALESPQAVTPEEILPLCLFLDACKSIPGISPWLLNVIEHGYSIQFRRRPPHFSGVLRQESLNLLTKRAIKRVPPSELESRFYSRYFVVPKRDGGLCPILDLKPINRALHKRAFRMIMLKQILHKFVPGTGLHPWIRRMHISMFK